MATTRGVRNRNPGNIDRGKDAWQGMAPDQSSDPRFIVFTTPQYGIRALAKVLLSYQKQHGCDTISKIISRWAPNNENNTSAYVADVAGRCGVDPNAVIDVDQLAIMLPLVEAIIAHENNGYAYPEVVVLQGLNMAGIADAKPVVSAPVKPLVAQVAGGTAVVAATVSQYSGPLKTAADQLATFTGAPVIAHVQTILLTLAGLCVTAGIVATWLQHKQASA